MAEALAFDEEYDEKDTIRILLVGHTGHGKRSTGNSLLGYKKKDKNRFISRISAESVTVRTEMRVMKRFGYRLEVVDSPGFSDTSGSDKFIKREIGRALFCTLPGFHCVALVLRPDRVSESIAKTIESFFDYFGKSVGEYACLILTYLEDDEAKEEYLSSIKPAHSGDSRKEFVNKLINLCRGKVLAIDNSNDYEEKENQVRVIIERINQMKLENKSYFTNDMFWAALNVVDDREEERKKKIEEKKRQNDNEEKLRKELIEKAKKEVEEAERRFAEEKQRLEREAKNESDRRHLEEILRLTEERNREAHDRRREMELQMERERQKNEFELKRMQMEFSRERTDRIDTMRRDFEKREDMLQKALEMFTTYKEPESSGCVIS